MKDREPPHLRERKDHGLTSERDTGEEEDDKRPLRAHERETVEDLARLRAPVIYRIIVEEGREELARPAISIWWSGLAAGLALSLSVLGKALLHAHLPEISWAPLVYSAGYPLGFIVVMLGRLQLFTENTLTAVLPVMADHSRTMLGQLSKLWGLVLLANVIGAALAALFFGWFGLVSEEFLASMIELSRPMAARAWSDTLAHGVIAGFLMAAMVWMLPSSRGYEIWVVAIITYAIALGDFTHVIAGSTEMGVLMITGETDPVELVVEFLIPAVIGNIVGGTGLFAMLAYGQVRKEL